MIRRSQVQAVTRIRSVCLARVTRLPEFERERRSGMSGGAGRRRRGGKTTPHAVANPYCPARLRFGILGDVRPR
jgi:hypothetical protein